MMCDVMVAPGSSALFTRRVSGPRVVLCTPKPGAATLDVETPADTIKVKGKYQKVIDGTPFECYGAHTNFYPCCYLTAACAIGASRKEMDAFLERLEAAVQAVWEFSGRVCGVCGRTGLQEWCWKEREKWNCQAGVGKLGRR
eukprot:g27233.t1